MRPFLAGFALAFGLLAAFGVQAAPQGIEARDAWIRATPPGATTAAGYVTLTNHGISSDRLMGGQTRAAQSVEAHHTSMAGGMMRMRPIVGGLSIGAGATVKFEPAGDHLMLTGLKGPLQAGQHVKVTLNFTRAGAVVVDFLVRADAPGGMGRMGM
jgi:hypothetical protein